MATGTISQVIGSTFDVQFPDDQLPGIYNAVEVKEKTPFGELDLVGEVQQHLGGGKVRAVALGSTDGLSRGMRCVDTGSPVRVPVGEPVLGRVFNLLGKPIDKKPAPATGKTMPIHRQPPEFSDSIQPFGAELVVTVSGKPPLCAVGKIPRTVHNATGCYRSGGRGRNREAA